MRAMTRHGETWDKYLNFSLLLPCSDKHRLCITWSSSFILVHFMEKKYEGQQ